MKNLLAFPVWIKQVFNVIKIDGTRRQKEVCTFVLGSSPEIFMLKMQYSAVIPKGSLRKEQKSHEEKAKLAVKDSESSFFNVDHDSGSSECESVC